MQNKNDVNVFNKDDKWSGYTWLKYDEKSVKSLKIGE